VLVHPYESSCRLVLPIRIAPWANNGFNTAALSFGMKLRSARVPLVVGKALVSTLSLTGIGKPCRRPSAAPEARALSAARGFQDHVAIDSSYERIEARQLLRPVQ
jgi:hypothetical protein